jgi:HEAT repeat protein
VKWKRSTIALLATVAGTWALAPLRTAAQNAPAAVSQAPATQAAPTPAYDPVAVLNDTTGGSSQADRDEAAQRLLSQQTVRARQILHDALVAPDDGGQLAVAHAIALDPDPDPSFIDPLFPLLARSKIAATAGRALAGYKADREVLTRLIEQATARRDTADFTRFAAIRAIGTIPEQRGAKALMQLLLSPDYSATIHQAAAEALINLTGLERNGEDAARWRAWWETARNKPEDQFRTEIDAQQDARLDRLSARYSSLAYEFDKQLTHEHNETPPQQREELLLRFLNSPEPVVRQIGTRLLQEDVNGGYTYTPAELQRLRFMIADSDPDVRRTVVKAISTINDPDALDALLKQLNVEPDPTVRQEIAKALGPIHDLRAVPTLIALLSDESLPTATAAANALENLAKDKLPTDPKLTRKTGEALKETILTSNRAPGSDDLRAACIEALTPLHQSDIVLELLHHKPSLIDAATEDSWDVRSAMLLAVGELNDPELAPAIVAVLERDPDAEVKVQAIKSLSTNPKAADYVENVGKFIDPDPERTQEVQDEAWKFVQGVFPQLTEKQLEDWQDRLKDPDRQLLALEALADKQQAQNQLEDLAITRAQIGDANMKLKPPKYGDAAASYKAALDIYDGLPPKPDQGAVLQTIVNSNMKALLENGPYSEAVTFAADRIKRDPSEQGPMGKAIADKVEALIDKGGKDDLALAQDLIDRASKMSPKLDGKHQDMLNSFAADIKKKSSSDDGSGPIPQSATVDGK